MDFADLFKVVGRLMVQYLSTTFTFAGHKISYGAVFIFVGLVGMIMLFINKLSD